MSVVPKPFRIAVDDAAIIDLNERLARTRWPDEIESSQWNYGTNKAFLRRLCDYWHGSFDWRGIEARLNALPQFLLSVDGTPVHFIHIKGRGPAPKPLLLTHGWPSTCFEYVKVVGPLSDPAAHGADPADAFDLVIPSIPGFTFSPAATQPGMRPAKRAGLWTELMAALGYDRFFAHGSDWGSYLTALLGYRHPQHIRGLHMTAVSMGSARHERAQKTPEEAKRARAMKRYRNRENGYQAIQSTKPQTLAYALSDSPAGIASWIVEKWRAWSDCDGDVERRFSKDELLTNIALYWFTNSINGSMRLYYENAAAPVVLHQGERIGVPCGFQLFPKDGSAGRARAEQDFNVVRWSEMDRGGHFPALEEPTLLVDDLRAFARALP
jgi:pimeloyl-ACP methyl ester carboxylesterase